MQEYRRWNLRTVDVDLITAMASSNATSRTPHYIQNLENLTGLGLNMCACATMDYRALYSMVQPTPTHPMYSCP